MAINFESVKLTHHALFGARLSGTLGRAEKDRLREFTGKCLLNAKLFVVLDLAELDSIGGGGAAILAGFQRELMARGGELSFVAANDVVQRFLASQFGDLPCRIFATLADAETALAATQAAGEVGVVPAAAARVVAPVAAAAAAPPDEIVEGAADSDLDTLLESYAASPVASPAASPRPSRPEPVPVAAPAPAAAAAATKPAARPRFVPLESALQALRDAPAAADLAGPLRDLLHGFDLAAEVTLCVRDGEAFTASPGGATLPADGRLVAALAQTGRPLLVLDAGDLDLSEPEAGLLAALRADLVLPIFRAGSLDAVAFVRRGGEGREYGVSETFALSLLTRWLAEPAAAPAAVGEAPADRPAGADADQRDLPAELRRKVVQMQALFSLSEDFSRVRDGARLMDLLCGTVTAQLGARIVAVLETDGEALAPRICRGVDAARVPTLAPCGPQVRAWLVEQPLPVPVEELPPLLHRFHEPLREAGFSWVAALRTRGELLGVLLLGEVALGRRTDLDLDFLSTLVNQAAIAMDNARMLQQAHEQSIGVIRTLVALAEQRHQAAGGVTERVSGLVEGVAREVNFPPEKLRDLIYGAVLRDIGMIPISDLVLRSPRKLTDGEWLQVKSHPLTGVDLLAPLRLPSTVQDVVFCHHERFNGEGYPRGLQGRAIPLSARIVAVVESYVAMVSDLPYRTALSDMEAVSILSENWGMRYDPDIVEAILRVLARETTAGHLEPEPAGTGASTGGVS